MVTQSPNMLAAPRAASRQSAIGTDGLTAAAARRKPSVKVFSLQACSASDHILHLLVRGKAVVSYFEVALDKRVSRQHGKCSAIPCPIRPHETAELVVR